MAWKPGASERVAIEMFRERQRQVVEEGFTPEHDDQHTDGELADAAQCYIRFGDILDGVPNSWPWAPEWWKPSPDRRRSLVKAAAMILAEIERLDREAARAGLAG